MSASSLAIVGLFFWVWSHELRHNYEDKQTRLRLAAYAASASIAGILLIVALCTAIAS